MGLQPWNASKIISTEIKNTEWDKLLSIIPEERKYLLRVLRVSENTPTDLETFFKERPDQPSDFQPRRQYLVYDDIRKTTNLLRGRNLPFSIRVTENAYSRHSKFQLCKIRRKTPLIRVQKTSNEINRLRPRKLIREFLGWAKVLWEIEAAGTQYNGSITKEMAVGQVKMRERELIRLLKELRATK